MRASRSGPEPREGPTSEEKTIESEWKLLVSCEYGYQADFAEATLREAGIPVLVKGREAGIWGPGFAGPTSQGLSLWVPDAHFAEARALLEDGIELSD